MTLLDEEMGRALEAKRSYRKELSVDLSQGNLSEFNYAAPYGWTPSQTYDQFSPGSFHHIESIRLSWIAPDYFVFVPKSDQSFSFTRPNGDSITPRCMFTDGGTIPKLFQSISELSPWGYAPAYLIHDWLFDLHHCGDNNYTFEAARDAMMEGIKGLMEAGVCEKNMWMFHGIYLAIDSKIARQIWNATGDGCPLPPDYSE